MRKDTAERLSAAALRILEREGPEAVTMRRLAGAVGISPMAIYHHFPGRTALLEAVTAREFDRLAERMDALAPGGEPRISDLLERYLDYAFDRPRVFDYVFSQPRTGARQFPRDFRERRSPTMNRLAGAVESAMKRGEIRKDDVREVSMMLWAHVHGYVCLYRAGRFALPAKQFRLLCRRSVRRLLRGLAR